MTSIDLTNEQVEELIGFYKLELEKSFKRTNEIISILKTLENKPGNIVKPVVKAQVSEKKLEPTVQPKAEKYIKWSDSIVEFFREKQKPLTTKEIFNSLVKLKNIPKSDTKKTKFAIQQSLYRLRKLSKTVQTIKIPGKKERLYSLTEWGNKFEADKIIKVKKEKVKPEKPLPAINPDIKMRSYAKNDWQGFIKNTLESKKRVLNLGELANVAMKHFELKSSEKTRTKANLAPVLTKLVTKDKILKTTTKKGLKGRSYGLSEWFDEKGNLVSMYK